MSPGLFKVSSHASTVGAEAQEEYVQIVGLMSRKLRAEQYHSSYFDRGAKAGSRLCTPQGWFCCQVSWGRGGLPGVSSARGSPASVALEPPDGAGKDPPPSLRLPAPRCCSQVF